MSWLGGFVFYILLWILILVQRLEDFFMNINWIARVKNKNFWVTLIPAVLLLIQTVAAVFGFTLDFGELGNQLLSVVNALFAVLVILGVVNDPTTAGISDSKQALTYTEPKKEE